MFILLGLVVTLLPFGAILTFPDRRKGFFIIFGLWAAFHLVLGLILQATNTFAYLPVLFASTGFGLCALFYSIKHRKGRLDNKMDTVFVCLILLTLFALMSVHFGYSGHVVSINGLDKVVRDSYSYPTYSDEWIAVSLANHAIKSGTLPLVNPLYHNQPFLNFLAGFHSFVAELLMLLSLSPLYGYVWISIVFGLITCISLYLMLSSLGVSRIGSAIAGFSILFITNSGNFPSTWSFIPYNLSLIFLICSIYGALFRNKVILTFGALLAFIFYPPMIIFIVPVAIGYLLSSIGKKARVNNDIWILCGTLVLGVVLVAYVLINNFTFGSVVSRALTFLVRPSLEEGIISFKLWNVLPFFILVFTLISLKKLLSRDILPLTLPIVVGSVFWIYYAYANEVILIEPSRVVAVTAFLLVALSAFGIDIFYNYVQRTLRPPQNQVKIMKLGVLIICILLAVFVTRINRWDSLPLVVERDGVKTEFSPSPFTNRYLTVEDLRIFEGIRGQRFVAPPWKALVVGVATENFPLESKHSTISNSYLKYADFMKADCEEKYSLANKYKIAYVYSESILCTGFSELKRSDEELVLYEFKNDF